MVNIKPLNDYVLVELIKEDSKTSSGIITAPTSKEQSWKWKVLKVWEGKKNDDWEVMAIENIKEWDLIYFTKYATEEIEFDWNKLLLVKIDNVIAKEE